MVRIPQAEEKKKLEVNRNWFPYDRKRVLVEHAEGSGLYEHG